MSSISVRGLDLRFGDVPVLSDLGLEVKEGEFLVLLGPSGCGKSTLLNCIAGLLDLSGGQVHIGGRNVTWAEPSERGIGMVFQSYALYPQMSVEKNLSFGLRVARMPKSEIAERVARAADVLQIEPLLKRKPGALSGGQRQRVAIGRALVRDVDVFLFDEPLSNLDAKLRTELRVELKRLHRRLGNTMLYVTHDQIEALTLADRIAIMRGGRIEQLDTPQGIYHRPVNRFVAGFIGSPGMNFLPGTLEERGGVPTFLLADGPGDDTPFSVPLDRYEFASAPEFGRPVELGIRPEHVSIEDARSLPASVQLSVDIVESMGADTILWSAVGGHVFTVRIDSEHSLDFGEGPVAGFDPARASLFDANGGARL